MCILSTIAAVLLAAAELPRGKGAYVADGSLSSPHATQAAAADAAFVYAISSTAVVRYDLASGRESAQPRQGRAPQQRLFLCGKLDRAHSNYPRQPHQSDLRVLDPATMAPGFVPPLRDAAGSRAVPLGGRLVVSFRPLR